MVKSNKIVPADMLEAIESCYQRCAEHVDEFASQMDSQPAPASVYHYTNSTGLLGILESGKVRLTDIFGLNDPSELRHGVNHACEILAAEALKDHSAAKLFAEKFIRVMGGGVQESAHFFVACFSCDGDDLGQWRAYGDNGRGFALGFGGGLIEKAFVNVDERGYGNAGFPVTYNDALLRKMHQLLVREVLPLIGMPFSRNLSDAATNEFMKELSIHLSVCVIRAAIFFKHEAYKNEQEYRFLQIREVNLPVDDLKHRTWGYSLIRFAEFDWKTRDQHALREIVIGPAANENDARLFARNCLLAGGFDPEKVIVRQSKIPYRSN
ncbi:Protein of unknown function [Nitrosospira sp. Nsp1]|nr:Protein of unknown function [Nitrosospira sp. Nsp1]